MTTEKRPEEIRGDIEQTRGDVAETIEKLGERFSPSEVKERVKESVRAATIGRVEDAASQAGELMENTRQSFMQTVRSNPIPAALTGIGLAWLLLNRRRGASAEVEYHEGGGARVGERARDVKERASMAMHDVKERVSSVAQQAPARARQVERRLEHFYEENLLAFGAAALALGSLVGLTLPRTEREDELLGEARDRLLEGAKTVAERASEKIAQP